MEIMKGWDVSDEILGTFAPIIVYWVYSGMYIMLGFLDNYRLHTRKDEDEKNLASKKDVFKGVLLQQAVHAVVATVLFPVGTKMRTRDEAACSKEWSNPCIGESKCMHQPRLLHV